MKGNTNNKRIIENSLKELDSTIQRLEKSLKLAPAEAITYRTIRGVCHFYQENPDGSEEYLGSDKEDRIRVLVKKKYEKMLLSAAKAEQEIFKRALKGFKTSKKYRTMNQVVEDFPEVFKEYLILDESTDAGSIQKWSKPIEPSIDPNDPKYSSFRTMRGETVRSKSEILIADRLYMAEIPYHYEKPLVLNHGYDKFKPDFTVLNKRTMKSYYWEHFGMMDKEDYSLSAKKRLEQYATNDIILGKDLIITFETSVSPLSTWYVDILIDEYLK